MRFFHKDCAHYVHEMGTYCGKHTERAVNPHGDDICGDFACGDGRLEALEKAVAFIREVMTFARNMEPDALEERAAAVLAETVR